MKIRLRHAAKHPVRQSITLHKRRMPKLERALYMRPLFRDPKFPQGTPINNSLILRLRCGHIEIRPQHPPKMRKLVYCPMCFMLWTERMAIDAQSKLAQRKRDRIRSAQHQEIEVMAKKSKKSASSESDRKGRKVFEFVKAAKDMVEETIMGVVYNAIKKVKSGTVAEITEAAVKGGLKDYTGQDPLVQTGVMLNRLKSMGSVRKVKVEAPAKAKASGKVVLKLKKKKAA
jgi:hypothetical protein